MKDGLNRITVLIAVCSAACSATNDIGENVAAAGETIEEEAESARNYWVK